MPVRYLFGPLLVLAMSVASCDSVPRDNPLDPQSDRFRDAGTVAGRVTGIYPPFDGRAGVSVRVAPLDTSGSERLARTGSDGAFEIGDLPGGRYAVLAGGSAYRDRADTVMVAPGQTARIDVALDALPVVTAQAARTVHIERWFPDTPVFQLEVEAEASDPDREADVESAALVVEGIAFREPLREAEPGRFTASINAARLPGGLVQSLLGRTLRIEVTDRSGNTGIGPPLALVRVIEQTPLTASPQGRVVIAQNPPALQWRPAELPFAFTYRAEAFLVDAAGIPNRVFSRTGIPSAQTTVALPEALVSGDYFWTVWVEDAAGNRSRSKEAGFIVP